jgi:hypothetical protein
MFAKLLMSNSMSDPLNVWNQLSDTLADGILFKKRRELQNPGQFNSFILLLIIFSVIVIVIFYLSFFITIID